LKQNKRKKKKEERTSAKRHRKAEEGEARQTHGDGVVFFPLPFFLSDNFRRAIMRGGGGGESRLHIKLLVL